MNLKVQCSAVFASIFGDNGPLIRLDPQGSLPQQRCQAINDV
ncbi:MAG TPA: hypothetical protein VMG09_10835 [Bacteroidota bacterium]|nr:hypothetical protein [Bacteroidota bacterium]